MIPWNLSANQQVNDSKIYFDSNCLEVLNSQIYVHLKDTMIETNTLRSDSTGLYIFDSDITNFNAQRIQKWKCPYCHHWWPMGEKCQNEKCPTNRW